jgi:hypothetical protein
MKHHTPLAACLLVAALTSRTSAQTTVDLRTQAKDVDFSAANFTKPSKTGTTLPASCSVGETFFKTDAPVGTNWYGCTSANVWTQQGGSGGGLPAMPGNADRVLSNNGATADWRALGGDVTGAPGALTVGKVQGRSIAATAPTDGQVLKWNAGGSQWQPAQESGGTIPAPPNYSLSFTAQTTVTISGTAHGFGTANLLVECYDSATPAKRIEADSITVHPTTYDVTVAFTNPQSGRCVLNGSSGGGGGGAVSSVFGRIGAVVAQSGDYSFSQISGAVSNSQLASGISAAKIGAGTVSDTVFGFLAGVTGDIQGQLNNKAALSHAHSLGGDISGDTGNATVARIQNRTLAATAPSDGQALVWNAGTSSWEPSTVAGGGGGASMASQLNDLNVIRSSATALTIGNSCSTTTPCNVRFGSIVYAFTRSCTATISAGSGTAYLYVTSGGTLTVGHNLTVSASAGCLAQGSITSFPVDALPLYSWTATSGTWDTSGGRDQRGWLSAKTVSAGTGITTVESAGRTIVAVDTAIVPTYITGTAVINFAAVPTGTCSADQTFTLAGAAIQDAVVPGWPAGLEAGLLGIMRVSASNTIAVRLCNLSGSAIDPASATFRATIIRSF